VAVTICRPLHDQCPEPLRNLSVVDFSRAVIVDQPLLPAQRSATTPYRTKRLAPILIRRFARDSTRQADVRRRTSLHRIQLTAHSVQQLSPLARMPLLASDIRLLSCQCVDECAESERSCMDGLSLSGSMLELSSDRPTPHRTSMWVVGLPTGPCSVDRYHNFLSRESDTASS